MVFMYQFRIIQVSVKRYLKLFLTNRAMRSLLGEVAKEFAKRLQAAIDQAADSFEGTTCRR